VRKWGKYAKKPEEINLKVKKMRLVVRIAGIACAVVVLYALLYPYATLTRFISEQKSKQPRQQWVARDDASSSHRGLVMCVGNEAHFINGALYTIQQLRGRWKSALPVSIMHCNELYADSLAKFAAYDLVDVHNLCDPAASPRPQRSRLKGWFCKPQALLSSRYEEAMIVDTDVLWFKDPVGLFQAPSYQQTGALFFRDRFLFETPSEKDGLHYDTVKRFIETQSRVPLARHNVSSINGNSSSSSSTGHVAVSSTGARNDTSGGAAAALSIDATTAATLADSNGVNFFWRHGADARKHSAIRHVQESSVVLVHKKKLPRTLKVLQRLLPTFNLGYGDKEIYWIAATIAGEPFSFEPYLAGTYGDCGEILHFDPVTMPYGADAEPYFLNCQYLTEGDAFVGKNRQDKVSKPVPATPATSLFDMGQKDAKSAGRCGACKLMGCTDVPPALNREIATYQQFHVDNAQRTDVYWLYHKLAVFFEKHFPGPSSRSSR